MKKVNFIFGCTNSSKTTDAIKALKFSEKGVYAAPLRMLAREVYEKLQKDIGEEHVGLKTGEERINENARILCCTIECTPKTGDILVVDEAHWLGDLDRGHVWTRVLINRGYNTYFIISASEAEPILTKMFADCQCNVIRKQRLSQLNPKLLTYDFTERIPKDALPAAVVVFSRKKVIAASDVLIRLGHNPAILYGAMPPNIRNREIEKLIKKECDIIITTDVMGHGVNLPIKSVIMCETHKFDGDMMRDINIWEAAQICGRAGRGKESGQIFIGCNKACKMFPKKRIVNAALLAANGKRQTDLDVEFAMILPTYFELENKDTNLLDSFDAWCENTVLPPYMRAQKNHYIRDRLVWLKEKCIELDMSNRMKSRILWDIITLPISLKNWPTICTKVLLSGDNVFETILPSNIEDTEDIENTLLWVKDLKVVKKKSFGIVEQDLDASFDENVDLLNKSLEMKLMISRFSSLVD